MVKAIVGANWGDEGKGKITDMLAEQSDVVIRFQGGANAGHTIINNYGRFALHILPSGTFYPHVTNIIGNGVALDIQKLVDELGSITSQGVPAPNLIVSERAQILMPYHRLQDSYEEERLGGKATVLEFQKGEADFSTIMASIKSAGYDGIFAPVSIETAAMIISQARDAGITCPILAGDTWDDISIAQRTGDKATEIFFSAFFDAADTSNEAGKAFVEGFTKWVAEDNARLENNGGVADVISSVTPCGYDAYMAAVGAIEAANSTDGAAIRDALAGLEIPGLITGDLKFDENGDAIKNYVAIKTFQDGEIVFSDAFTG